MELFCGFILVLITGLFWIGIGIAVSRCSAKGWNYSIVSGLTYLGASLICAMILAGKRIHSGASGFSGFGFFMSGLAGVAHFYSYLLTAKAMQRGPNGLVWSIMQSGMLGTFLMGMLFFGEKPAVSQLSGMFLLLSGILVMGMTKVETSSVHGKNWMLLSLGALLLTMTTQCCNTLPSYFHTMEGNSHLSRTLGLYLGGALAFAFTTLPGMLRRRDFGGRGEWATASLLAVLYPSASLFFFYRGLDLLSQNGCAGLGYPIAIGVCVIGFSLYSLLLLKEKVTRLGMAGLGAVGIGMILIALK